MIKGKRVYPLLILSLIFLFNPNINLIDVLPDCVAYLLMIFAIGSLSETVPYLAECKSALIKLTLVNLIKIPAFSVMYSNMVSGKDIVPLFTLVFAVLELILIYSAVDNGFKALGYIGERTDCKSVRDPIVLGKNKETTPEAIKTLTFIFFITRATLNVIPELLLLTPEDIELRKKLADAYPAILVISILISLVAGVVWLNQVLKYVRAIHNAQDLNEALDVLIIKDSSDEMSVKEKQKKLIASLTLLAFSSLFIFDISFADFGGYNKLPHFIYGILLFTSVYSFITNKRTKFCSIIGAAGFSLSSLLVYLFNTRFFENYTYVDLAYSKMAMAAYTPIKISAVAESVFAMLLLASAALAMVSFIKDHTDVAPSDPSYSKTNMKNHRATIKKTLPIFIMSALINLMKCANVFIKQTQTLIYSEVNPEGIAASSLPVMDTVIFFACVVFVIYSFVTVSGLKDEVRFKYGKD